MMESVQVRGNREEARGELLSSATSRLVLLRFLSSSFPSLKCFFFGGTHRWSLLPRAVLLFFLFFSLVISEPVITF